ncbi:hypothetical protein KAR91_50755 [Candidatus Pacearchaeota archaeon]|nr:hypothetical protein [Candidatus Pacearchaeota archaeon]
MAWNTKDIGAQQKGTAWNTLDIGAQQAVPAAAPAAGSARPLVHGSLGGGRRGLIGWIVFIVLFF